MAYLNFNRIEKSSDAYHIFEKNYRVDKNKIRVLTAVSNCKFFDAFEGTQKYIETKND